MRYGLAAVVVGLLGLGFVLHERKNVLEQRLGPVASQLAGRPVKVHCQGLAGDLVDATAHAGTVKFDANGNPSDSTDLKRATCAALRTFRHELSSPRFRCVLDGVQCPDPAWRAVQSVHVLAHEVWHLRGDRMESVAECHALQTTAQAAVLLGADAVQAEAVARYAWLWFYPRLSDDYRTPECRDGGPLDLRPADAHWP